MLEALRYAYEASGRAAPIDPAEYAAASLRTGGPGRWTPRSSTPCSSRSSASRSRSTWPRRTVSFRGAHAGPPPARCRRVGALRAPGFDETWTPCSPTSTAPPSPRTSSSSKSGRRVPLTRPAARLDAESTVSAVRTLNWAARVLDVECPDSIPCDDRTKPARRVTHVPGERPSVSLAPRVLSGSSAKQLAFLAGRAMTWYRPEYRCLLYYPAFEDLRELVAATLEIPGHRARARRRPSPSFDRRHAAPQTRHLGADERAAIGDAAPIFTAARAGLLLRRRPSRSAVARRATPRPRRQVVRTPAERVAGDLVAFCASRAHAALRGQFLRMPSPSIVPAPRGA